MGKFDGILICTDLDGTLYKNDKTVSDENREAIEYFKREGGYFTFVTGRMPYYSMDAYRAARPNVPFGCINGGGIYDGEGHKYIWQLGLPKKALELVRHIDERFSHVGIQLCAFEKTYFAKENVTTARHRLITGIPNYTCDYRDFSEPLGKIMFCTDVEEEILAVERELRAHRLSSELDFIRSEKALFEILPKGVNKGLGLRKLAEFLGVDMSRTVAVGDYDNDAAMLKEAGIGFAVSNASHAALMAADKVTVSNEEHALARIISEL